MNKKRLFLLNLFFSILAFGSAIFCGFFSADDYSAIFSMSGYKGVASSYRVPIAIVYYIVHNLLNYNTSLKAKYLILILLIIEAYVVTELSNMVFYSLKSKDIRILVIVNGSFIFMFENAFFAEWLWFAGGAIQWGIGILTMCLATKSLFFHRNTFGFCAALVWMIVSTGSYQMCLVFFLYCFLISIIVDEHGNISKKVFSNALKCFGVCILSVVANVVLTKIVLFCGLVSHERREYSARISPIEFFNQSISGLKVIFYDGGGYYPRGFLIAIVIFLICTLAYSIKSNKDRLSKAVAVCSVALIGLVTVHMAFLMQGIVYIVPRVVITEMGIISVFIIIPLSYEKLNDFINIKMIMGLLIVIICVSALSAQLIITDASITKALDNEYYQRVYARICKYEEETGIEIRKVGVIYDQYPIYKYYSVLNHPVLGDASLGAMYTDWSNVNAMNYYLDTEFIKINVSEEIKKQFESKNWDSENLDEQLLFINDELYICAY